MRKVLVTGFDPFGGERLNPSWEVVKLLGDLELSGAQIVVRQLPCVFGKAIDALNAAIDEVHPEMVLCVGQAGRLQHALAKGLQGSVDLDRGSIGWQ